MSTQLVCDRAGEPPDLMLHIVGFVCAVWLVLGGAIWVHAAAAQPASAWERVFELTTPGRSFAAIAAGSNGEWVAGGSDVVVTALGGQFDERGLDGLTMMAFGADDRGNLFAVGTKGSIWRRAGDSQWKLEHQTVTATTPRRGRDDGLLVDVRLVPAAGGASLIAYGPRSQIYIRDAEGNWSRPQTREQGQRLEAYAQFGPSLRLSAGCYLQRWLWLGGTHGWMLCHDGRAFAVDAVQQLTSMGRAPPGCRKTVDASAQRGSEVFASCGEQGQLWQFAGGRWAVVAGVKGIRALAASERCVVAASERAVWRECR